MDAIPPQMNSLATDNSPYEEVEEKLTANDENPYAQSLHNALPTPLSRVISAVSSKSTVDPGPPPDGGLKAWTQVAMGHLVLINSWGIINSFGVFQTYYVENLRHPPSDISWIGSLQVFFLFFIGALSGRAMDAGLFRPAFLLGYSLMLIGIFTTSAATKYWQVFLAQGVCVGVGMGIFFTPCIALVSTYFSKKKAFALCLTSSGTATGGVIFPIVVQQLLPKIGFGWTVRVLGFLVFAMGALSFALLEPRLPPRKAGPLVEWAAFRELPYLLYCIGAFFSFWGLFFAFYYVGAFGRDILGFSYSESINVLLIANAVGLPGRLIPALLSDRYFGPLNIIIVVVFGTAVILYCWSAVDSKTGLYVFASFYGLISPGLTGLFPAGIASLNSDLSKTGTRMGMVFTIVSFACLTGPSLGGALVQQDGGHYLYSQMWAGSSWVVGGLGFLAARLTKTGLVFKARA